MLDAACTWHPPQIVATISLTDGLTDVGKRIFVSLNLAATFEPSINITNLQPHITIDFMLPSQCSLMITQLWSVLSALVTWSEFPSQLLCFLCSLQWGRILSVPGEGNDGWLKRERKKRGWKVTSWKRIFDEVRKKSYKIHHQRQTNMIAFCKSIK